MSAQSPSAWVKKLHINLEPGTFKHTLGEFLESRKVEVLIIVLVLCDVLLLGVEHGIDRHMLCIDGAVTPVAPDDLVALGHAHHEEHGVAHGHFLQEFIGAAPTRQLRSGHGASFARGDERDAWLMAAESEGTEFAQGWMFLQEQEEPKPLIVKPKLMPHVKSHDAGHINKIGSPYRVSETVGPPGAEPIAVYEATGKVRAQGALKEEGSVAEAEKEAGHHGEAGRHHHEEEHHHRADEKGHAGEHGGKHDGEHGGEHGGAGAEHHGGEGHSHGHHVDAALVCETRHGPQSHGIEHFCHMASIYILSIFLVEILGKLWVNTHEFIRSPVEMLDLVVVSLSLFVDVIVLPFITDPETRGEAELVVALLIVCRGWRIVRIFHGAFEVVHHQIEHEEKLNHRIHELQDALRAIKPDSQVLNDKDGWDAENAHQELEKDRQMASGR